MFSRPAGSVVGTPGQAPWAVGPVGGCRDEGDPTMRTISTRSRSLAIAGLLVSALAASGAANWKGRDWQDDLGSFVVDTVNDWLIVSAFDQIEENRWGSAWYTTSAEFRAQPVQEISVAFIDEGLPGGRPAPGPQIWLYEPEDPITGEWGSQFSIGAWQRDGATTYQLGFIDFDPPYDGGFIDTGVVRSAGQHQLRIARREDETVEFYLDGILVWTNTLFAVHSFGDIYLVVHGDQIPGPVDATFTDFQLNDQPVAPGPLTVEIDVRPFVYPNVIDLRNGCARVPVAIWSTRSYRAEDVDPRSVRLGGARAHAKCLWDLDRDGDRDLVLVFSARETGLQPGDTEVVLTGALKDGTEIVGTDTVVVLPRRKGR